jgi:hypothetical protein
LATRANRREQRLQSALLDRLTFKYERLVAREIARTMLNANLSDPMGIEAAEAAHAERLSKIMGRMWLESGDQMVSQVFGVKKKSLLSSFEPTVGVNTIMTDYVRQWGAAKVVQISRTTTNQLKSVIKGGIEEGLSERDVGKLIRERAPTIAASRAQTIARTETHAAANFAVQQSAESTGIEMMREWVSAENERTREAHLEANGQIVGMQEDFVVDGENLAYPGDPSGSPENVINCRCSVVFTEKTTDIAPSITPEPQNSFDSGFGKEVNSLWDADKSITQMANAIKVKPSSVTIGKSGVYYPSSNAIKTTSSKATFVHEYGHFIDFNANEKLKGTRRNPYSATSFLHTDLFTDAANAGLRNNLVNRRQILEEFRDRHFEKQLVASKRFPDMKIEKYVGKSEVSGNLSDIYDAATRGYVFQDFKLPGHGKTYYKDNSMVATETFANMSVLYGKKEWAEVKAVFPTAAAKFEKMMEEIKAII